MAVQTLSPDEITQLLRDYDAEKSAKSPPASQPSIPSREDITQMLHEYDRAKATQGTIGPDYGGRLGRNVRSDLSWLLGPTVDQGRQTIPPSKGLLPSMGEFAVKSPEIVGEAIPTPSAQNIQDVIGGQIGEDPGFAARAGAGVFKANAKALGYVATLGPVLGALSQTSPLLGRMVEGAVGVDILAHVPDMKRNIEVAADQGDVEGVARGITEMGLGLWFGTKSTMNAGRRGAASESPLVNELLTKKIETDFTPTQVRQVIDRVQTGKGSPAEKEMVRFLEETGVPIESIQGGVVTERIPRFQSPAFNRYMGVRKSGRVSLSAIEPLTTKEKNAKQDRSAIEEQQQTSNSNVEQVPETAIERQAPIAQEASSKAIVEQVLAPAAPVGSNVPSPPPSVMAIAKRAGKDLIPMSGPDSKVHWFTFDGFQERADGSFVPQLTSVGPEVAPGLSKGSSYLMPKLVGYAPMGQLPWRERLQLPPAAIEPAAEQDRQEAISIQSEQDLLQQPTYSETPAPVPSETPKLRSMENQGDLLSNQTEDFALASERGIDFERREQERVAAETRAREAAEIQAKQQLGFDNLNAPVEGANREQSGVPVTGKVDTGLGSGVEPSVPTSKVRRPKATVIDERPPDIIDTIQDLIMPTFSAMKGRTLRPAGKGIQTKKYANDISEYNESYDILWKLHASNPARKLFAIGKGGTPIDELRDMLREQGAISEDATAADVFDMMLAALDVRKNFQGQNQNYEKTLNQGEQFQNVAIENKRAKEGDRQRAVKIPASYLEKGDQFKLDGELVKVGGIDSESGGRIVTNGERFGQQVLKGNEVIYADYRTLKKADPAKQNQPIPAPSDNYEPTIVPETETTDDRPFSIVPTSGRASKGTTASAQGIPAIREMIQSSNLPANTKRVFDDFLSQPVMQRPEFSDLVVALRDKILIGGRTAGGVAEVDTKFIELSESDANSETLGHELAHFFFEMLPKDVQAKIDGWRVEEIKSKHGEDASALLLSGRMTSEQAAEMGLPIEDYHLINPSEFLAHMISTKFAEDSFAGRNDPEKQTLIDKIKAWLRELWNSIKRVFKVAPSKQQVYEDILAGKIVNTPRSGTAYEKGRQASFVKDPNDAINEAKKQQTVEQQQVEGKHQVSQSADIVKVLEKFGAVSLTPKAQELLRYDKFVGIQVSGENLLGVKGDDYRSIKAKNPDPYFKTWIGRIASSQMRGFDATLADVIAKRDAKSLEVMQPAFINLLMKEMSARNKADIADDNVTFIDNFLDAAIAKAEQALRYERNSDRVIDEIKGQIRELYEAKTSSVAMVQLLEDMVTVLASTPDGWSLLTDPAFGTRTDIAKVYKDLKSSAGQPLHSPTLIKWATQIIQRNKVLRENLVAANMFQQAPIRSAMNAYEKEVLNELKKNPARTIKAIRKATARSVTQRERAQFAWRQLNKRVMDKLEELEILNDAAEVAENIKKDADFKSLVKEMQTDSEGLGYQKPFEPFLQDTVLLPSGRELNVKADHAFDNETSEFLVKHKEIEAGIKELQTWLGITANREDINFKIHARNLQTLDTYYTGMGLMVPSDKNNAFSSFFGLTLAILNNVVDDVGGRPAYALQKAVRRYDEAHFVMTGWLQKWAPQLTSSRIEAMKSHQQKWGSFSFKNDLTEANNWWWNNIGNLLAYSHNIQQGGFKIGDVLPTGEKVTKADMEQLRMMSDASSDLYKKGKKQFSEIDVPYAETDLGGYTEYREPTKPGENGTPRTFNRSASEMFKDIMNDLEATQSTDPKVSGPAIDNVLAFLDKPHVWATHRTGLVWDRYFKTAKATVFDGPGGALQVLKNDAIKFGTASEFMREVENLTGYTFDEVKRILIPEWSHPIVAFHREVKIEESSVQLKPLEQRTAFTISRKDAIAPYTFYEYGFKVGSSMTKFASGIQARAVDRVVKGLEIAKTELEKLQRELQEKIKSEALIGGPGAERRVMNRQAELNKNGENYDRYQNLNRRIRDVQRQIDVINGSEFHGADDALGRVVFAITGPLLGAPSTARNILDGPRYVGWQMDRMLGSHIKAHGLALWYGWLGSNMKNLAKGVGGVGKATLKTLAYGPTINLVKTLLNPKDRSLRGYAKNVMGTWMEEIMQMHNDKIKDFAEGILEGTMHEMPPGEKETNARLVGSILTQGTLLDASMSRAEKWAHLPLAIWETFLVNPNRKLNPAFGDAMLNAGLIRALRSSWGPLAFYEQQAARLADMHMKGYRPFDFANLDNPINELHSKEVFGPSWIRWITSREDLRNASFVFKRGGLDFQKLMVKLIGRIKNGEKAATLLDSKELINLTNSLVNNANRGGVANNAAWFYSKDPLAVLLKPFMGWPLRTLSDFNNLMSWSTQAKGQKGKSTGWFRFRQAMFTFTFTLLPLLFLFGILVSYGSTWAYRELKKQIYNQELPYRMPHEREGGASGFATGIAIEGLNAIPLVGGALAMGLNDSTPRATMNPDFVMVQKAKDIIKYAGGVWQTGDMYYKLPEFLMGMVPDSRIIASRMPGFEGRAEANNAANLLRRYGPMDDMRPMGVRGAGTTANELSPYGDRMINAAMEGKTDELQAIYNEAVEVARNLGKANPERVVTEIYRSRNPYDRVFKRKITEQERQSILNAASSGERAILEEAERKFAAGAALLGSSSNFTSEQASAARSSGGGSARALAGMAGASAGVGAVLGIPRSRTSRGRRTRISTGRRGRRRGSLRTRARRPGRLRQPRGLRAGRRRRRGSLRGLV